MESARKRRVARLEAECLPVPSVAYPGAQIIVVNEGETTDEAILRTCGPAGLPPAIPGRLRSFIVTPRWVTPRSDA